MKVVLLSESFTKNMGYMGNMLPKYLARFGAEVHMVTLDLPIYFHFKDFKETYSEFYAKSALSPHSVEHYDGYLLHVLGHKKIFGYMCMEGLWNKLNQIKPDIVYSFNAIGWIPMQAAVMKPFLGYKLFTGCHTTASVFPLAKRQNSLLEPEYVKVLMTRALPGRIVSLFTEKCYGATTDCADIASRFFGVQDKKIDICPLGVDTDIFRPVKDINDLHIRADVRKRFGFADSDIVCIYTGRFSEEKNPLVLAKAVAHLRELGEPFRAIFFGNGVQKESISSMPGCIIHPFVPVNELGDYFRAADIGVWPTQESTSMLDAAACGLPIVVNDTLLATERIEGNGLTYKLNDVDDMINELRNLRNPEERSRLGSAGAAKMKRNFSWESIARRRLTDFADAMAV